jgi:hypothetical protein
MAIYGGFDAMAEQQLVPVLPIGVGVAGDFHATEKCVSAGHGFGCAASAHNP